MESLTIEKVKAEEAISILSNIISNYLVELKESYGGEVYE